jgi:hypothetical protein
MFQEPADKLRGVFRLDGQADDAVVGVAETRVVEADVMGEQRRTGKARCAADVGLP